MNEFHIIAQAKGGVGKSLVSSIVGQFKRDHQQVPTICVDIDPLNNTFSQFKSLEVGFVDVTENGKEIVPTKFDTMINAVADNESDFVVDSGASVFISLMRYLNQDRILSGLAEDLNKKVFVHTIIVGGQAKKFTLDGLAYLLNEVPNHPNVKIVVWINEHFGPVEIDSQPIENLKIVADAKDRMAGFITLHTNDSDAFNIEFEQYTTNHQTLNDVLSDNPTFASKRRIDRFMKDVFGQLEIVVGG
ncbi:MAG: hypothetical protein WBK19_11015 [Azonexus sp.]